MAWGLTQCITVSGLSAASIAKLNCAEPVGNANMLICTCELCTQPASQTPHLVIIVVQCPLQQDHHTGAQLRHLQGSVRDKRRWACYHSLRYAGQQCSRAQGGWQNTYAGVARPATTTLVHWVEPITKMSTSCMPTPTDACKHYSPTMDAALLPCADMCMHHPWSEYWGRQQL